MDGSEEPLAVITNEQIMELTRRFVALPFQYYGEKELHFDLHRLLVQAGSTKCPKIEVVREQPTCVRYTCEKSGENKGRLITDDEGTAGHHDLMVRRGAEKVVIELFHGREFTLSERGFAKVDMGGEIFSLRASCISPTMSKLHFDNDCTKLMDLVKYDEERGLGRPRCSIVMFVSAFHLDERKENIFHRKKRDPLLEHIANKEGVLPNGIDIWYIERAFTGNLAHSDAFIRYPDGRKIAGLEAMGSLCLP